MRKKRKRPKPLGRPAAKEFHGHYNTSLGATLLLSGMLLIGAWKHFGEEQEKQVAPVAMSSQVAIPFDALEWLPEEEIDTPSPAIAEELPPVVKLGIDLAEAEEALIEQPAMESPSERPAAILLAPLEIRVSGPVDSQVGTLVELHAETTQDVTAFAWSIDPPVRGLLEMDDGAKAVFSNPAAGDYLVIVSAANGAGQSAHATFPFTLRPAPPENPVNIHTLADAHAPLPLSELMPRWVNAVASENYRGEGAAMVSAFRQVASVLSAGQLVFSPSNPDQDPYLEVEIVAEQLMGPQAFARWEPFVRFNRDYLYPGVEKGYIQTPQQFANAFNQLAGELEADVERR